MRKEFDIEQVLNKGIQTEFDYQRALIAERRLRLLSKQDGTFTTTRTALRDRIEAYEQQHWNSKDPISKKKLLESEVAELTAEDERVFVQARKSIIREKLAELGLSQQDLGALLGHKSKTHMSELMNGVSPFTLRDLVLINRLLKIDMSALIPPFVHPQERKKVEATMKRLKANHVQIDDHFSLVAT